MCRQLDSRVRANDTNGARETLFGRQFCPVYDIEDDFVGEESNVLFHKMDIAEEVVFIAKSCVFICSCIY